MSKYRHWWRPNVERELKAYPELKRKKNELQKVTTTPVYGPTTHGPGVSDPTASAALRQLPDIEERVVSSIDAAIEETLKCSDGQEVMRLINMVYFKQSHTLTGAAMAAYVSMRTAHRRVNRFIYCVAKHGGYLEEKHLENGEK